MKISIRKRILFKFILCANTSVLSNEYLNFNYYQDFRFSKAITSTDKRTMLFKLALVLCVTLVLLEPAESFRRRKLRRVLRVAKRVVVGHVVGAALGKRSACRVCVLI